jgi:hypothetical protein
MTVEDDTQEFSVVLIVRHSTDFAEEDDPTTSYRLKVKLAATPHVFLASFPSHCASSFRATRELQVVDSGCFCG